MIGAVNNVDPLAVPEEERTKKEIVNTKELVGKILRKSERARNDDNWLIFQFLQESGQDIEIVKKNDKICIVHTVVYEDFGKQPSRETITRLRRWYQMEKGMFLPTDIDVLDRRASRSKTFRKTFGYKGLEK